MSLHTQRGLEGFLARLTLRSELTADEQTAVLNLRARSIKVDRGAELVLPGNMIEHATLVVDGLLGRYDQMADGSRQLTALHIPGDMSDLHSVPMPRPAWGIEALSYSTVMLVSHSELRRLVATFPGLAMAFWRDTVTDASILAKWAANLGRADAAARLAHLLCEIGMRMEAMNLGTRDNFAFPVTQIHLADAMGITQVHVNRTVTLLKRCCGLTMVNGVVTVGDWPSLQEMGRFDAEYLLLDYVTR